MGNQFGAHDKVECPRCHGTMSVVRRTPHATLGARYERQTVECAICKFSEERTVDGGANDPTSILSLRA